MHAVLKRSEMLLGMLIVIILAAIFLPFYGAFEGYEVFLTIITFLFSILAGFSIASAWEEYSAVGTAISKEVSVIIAVYSLVSNFSKHAQKKFVDLLDIYMILAYIAPWEEFSKTNKIYGKLISYLESLKIRGEKQKIVYEVILNNISDWAAARQEQIYLGNRKIPFYQWLTLIVLAGLLIVFLFFVRTSEPISIVTTVVFSFSIVLSLLIIRDLDTYYFGSESWSEPLQQVFEIVGKKRFYWENYIKDGTITPPKGIKYRTKVPKGYLKELG